VKNFVVPKKPAMKTDTLVFAVLSVCLISISGKVCAQRQMENLDRGLVAVNVNNGVFLSWRMLGTDPRDIAFNIYRNSTLVNQSPITGATNMTDAAGNSSSVYRVHPVLNGTEQPVGGTATVWGSQTLTVNLQRPPGGTNASGSYTYSPNDISVGDVDGDGQYELILKWDPSNSKDNSQPGYTGNVYIDCYKLNGTRLWRIDLGRNIRAGAHYTQFLVGDYDGDGKAEVAMKTAPRTIDGTGKYINMGPAANADLDANYINSSGYILQGPEYLTIFNGETGAEMATVNYVPGRGNVGSWGDTYGNRLDRYNATNAYLDGVKPSMIFQRGYYTRMVVAAWDWNGTNLIQRWVFDSNNQGSGAMYGQGNHSIMSADGNGNGFDEIYTGGAAINHEGNFKWSVGLGHGDANHIGDFDTDNPGLEIWQVTEPTNVLYDQLLISASDGRILWGSGSGSDNGRGLAADISAASPGHEMWSSRSSGIASNKGVQLYTNKPSMNFRVYWDGDLQDELLDGTRIDKWTGNGTTRLITLIGNSCNGTKNTPNLSADILGDWREEVITHDGASRLYIHTTTIPTTHKLYTLMHDPAYRNAISWQQSSYNQPPHLSFYLGDGVENAPAPNIVLVGATNTADCNGDMGGPAYIDACGECVGGNTGNNPCVIDCNGQINGSAFIDECGICVGGNTGTAACISSIQAEEACSYDGSIQNNHLGFGGDGFVDLTNQLGSSLSIVFYAEQTGTKNIGIRFANGSANNRPMRLNVNNQQQDIDFPNAGAWNNWQTTIIQMQLQKGGNLITLESLSQDGGPNIDQFMLYDDAIVRGSCTQDCNGEFGGLAYTDDCSNCIGGSTGLEACQLDCNYVWGGTAYMDDCNTCIGGTTGLAACTSMQSEFVCSHDGVYQNEHHGFNGTGYVNTDNFLGASISFNMTSNISQTANMSVRYANGTGDNRPINVQVNGQIVTTDVDFPSTGEWAGWNIVSFEVPIMQGLNQIVFIANHTGGIANVDMLWVNNEGVNFGPCELLEQEIVLNQGWNLISTYLRTSDSTIETLFNGLDVAEIKNMSSFWRQNQPGFLNSLKTITTGEGYLVYMNTAGILFITGTGVLQYQSTGVLQYAPTDGWQLIGVPFQSPALFSYYFDTGNCEIIKDFEGFWLPGSQIGTIEQLNPGKAYFVKYHAYD
jgi:hypothetical protein